MKKVYFLVGVTYHPFLTIEYLVEEIQENGYLTCSTSKRITRARKFEKIEDATALINKLKSEESFRQVHFCILKKTAREATRAAESRRPQYLKIWKTN